MEKQTYRRYLFRKSELVSKPWFEKKNSPRKINIFFPQKGMKIRSEKKIRKCEYKKILFF